MPAPRRTHSESNSLHECGCLVRAVTGLKRSDEQFLMLTRVVAAEAKRAGVSVHREGLKIGYLLVDATFDPETRTYDPVAAEEAFASLSDAYVRLVNAQGAQTHRYQLDSLGQASGYIMATLYRSARGAWMLKTNSQEGMGNTFKKMLPAIQVACRNLLSKHV